MTAPFGPREFQLVLLRRMADHQPGLVEDARHELSATLAEMREANRRWQAMVRAPGGRGALRRYRSVLGEPVSSVRRTVGDLECDALRWPTVLWPDLWFEVMVAPGGAVWNEWLVRAPGVPGPELRTVEDLRPWSGTVDEVARAFMSAARWRAVRRPVGARDHRAGHGRAVRRRVHLGAPPAAAAGLIPAYRTLLSARQPGPSDGSAQRAPGLRTAHACGTEPAAAGAIVRALGRPAVTVSLEQLRRCHVAVDLGAARTRVYVKGLGLVVDEPSVAAVNTRTGSLIAVGALAEQMTGRTPDYIRVARPVTGGTVVDIEMAQRMLRHLLGEKLRLQLRRKPRLRAAACTPHDSDPLAQRAAVETMVGLGARRVELVDTLIAAAVGCGLPVEQPTATMIMVCGAATTQIAVLSLGSIVSAVRIPVGGDAIDHAVIQHLRQHHALMLPSQSVRPLQLALSGGGLTAKGPVTTEIHGRDVATGLARSVHVDTAAVREAIHAPLTAVLDGLGKILRDCPPDLVADLADCGIMMVGGSALLPGLDQMLRDATGMPVHIAERPDVCAVLGLGAMLDGKIEPMVLDPLAC